MLRAPRRYPLTLAAASAFAFAALPTAAVVAHGGGGRGHHGGDAKPTTPALPPTLALPNGWQPEGIAAGKHGTLYVGSIPTGAVQQLDPRTGQDKTLVPAHAGRAAIGLKVAGKKLVVAGGTTGRAFIYDAKTGADVADIPLTTGNSFINDVAITKHSAYLTDSRQPQLYRVDLHDNGWHRGHDKGHDDDRGGDARRRGKGGEDHHGHRSGGRGRHGDDDAPTTTPAAPTATTIPITGAFQYDDDPATNEANGIVALPGKQQLLVVQSRTGKLFRVDGRTGASVEVPIAGGPLTNGDGLLLIGRVLFVVQNRLNQIAVVKLARNHSAGEVKQTISSPLFRVPTTLAASRFGLYTVNARFGTTPTEATDYDVVRVPLAPAK